MNQPNAGDTKIGPNRALAFREKDTGTEEALIQEATRKAQGAM